MKTIWVASYPRSGNTFVRFLLYEYLYADIHDTTSLSKAMPDLHDLLSNEKKLEIESEQTIFVKTHFQFSNRHPYFDNTHGIIYILRNPRDVLLSHIKHFVIGKNEEYNYSKSFICSLGLPYWRSLGMGTWPENIGSWLYHSSTYPSLFLKYENIKMNTIACLSEMIRFLGLEPDPCRLKKTAQNCTLDNMRRIEKIEKEKTDRHTVFGYKRDDRNFVNKGAINQALTHIGDDIEKEYNIRFGNIISMYGYR